MLAFVLFPTAHVPSYGNSADGCYTPPHHHSVSQAFYIRGSGGLELHITSPTTPFDIPGGELIDYDIVLSRQYDQTTYDLYVGCGGCVASMDAIVIPPVALNGYEKAEVEPFTQTTYYSVFPKADRKFNASQLAGCSENHFTLRLVDYHNRTDGSVLTWSAVVGLKEQFTFWELLSFPNFILRNHSESWNEMGYSAPISFLILAPLLIYYVREFCKCLKLPYVDLDYKIVFKGFRPYIEGKWAAREWIYEIAVIAFVGTMIEEFWHLMYAQAGVPVGWGLWVGLFAVIGFANGLPLFQVLSSWAALQYDEPDGKYFRCWPSYLVCSGRAWWAPLEILFGFSYFFLLGSGFWLGPSAIMLAGLMRLGELRQARDPKRPLRREHKYRPPADSDPFFPTAPRDMRPSLFF